jgi:hypothetical protein
VGEFGMNEWARLAEISTNTRMYLSKRNIESINQNAAAKIARIHFAKLRHDRAEARRAPGSDSYIQRDSWQQNPWERPLPTVPPPSNPMAVELPGDAPYPVSQPSRYGSQYEHRPSIADQKYVVVSDDGYRQPTPTSLTNPQTPPQRASQPLSPPYTSPASLYPQSLRSRPSAEYAQSTNSSTHPQQPSPRQSIEMPQPHSAPPVPAKMPLNSDSSPLTPAQQPPGLNGGPRTFMNMGDLARRLPYPDMEEPPPAVNTASKPRTSR